MLPREVRRRLGPDEIAWRPVFSLGPRRIALAEVIGFRWPFPLYLWIECGGGKTLGIVLTGISDADRERVRAWLSRRWVDGGLVAG